jgi:hypothetical protein
MRGARIFSAAFVVLALAVLWDIRDLDYWAFDGPGPKLLPFWVAVIMIAAAAYLVFWPDRSGGGLVPARVGAIAGYLALVVATVVLFSRIGALAAMTVFIAAELVLIEKYPVVRAAAIGVASTVTVYVVFVLLLHLRLPGFNLAAL